MQQLVEFNEGRLSQKLSCMLGTVDMVTKILKLQKVRKDSEKKKLVISSNWLGLFGFPSGIRVIETVAGYGEGMSIKPSNDTDSGKLVYKRSYKHRDEEIMMDIRHQDKILTGFGDAKKVHITFKMNELLLVPVFEHSQKVVDEGLKLQIKSENGTYAGILEAIRIIKDKAFSVVEIDAGDEFKDTQECVLLSMQLRRLGYELSSIESGKITAKLGVGKALTYVEIQTSPISNPEQKPSFEFNYSEPFKTFAAFTAGVDITSIEQDGFKVSQLLDYRPNEPRDVKKSICKKTGEAIEKLTDKTEFGAISAAVNCKNPKIVINEDIYDFEINRIRDEVGAINFFHVCITCTDFTNLKNDADKQKAIISLSSTRDMFIKPLEIIQEKMYPVVLVENVPNFSTSVESFLYETRLVELGYKIYKKVMNAKDYNGYTTRKRVYIFATLLDVEFNFPEPVKQTVHVWNDIVIPYMHKFRNISHTVTIKKAVTSGRLRAIREGDSLAPTIFRAQNRMVKDACYLEINNEYFFPDVDILKMLMGIPEHFDTSLFSNEIITETIGQSVDVPLHSAIAKMIKKHIQLFIDKSKTFTYSEMSQECLF